MFNIRIVKLKNFVMFNELIQAFLTYGKLWGFSDEKEDSCSNLSQILVGERNYMKLKFNLINAAT